MLARDPSTLPKRDARGRLLEPPIWLKPGWKRVHDAGLGLGGSRRKLCARLNCRDIAMKRSEYCRQHDVNWQRQRAEQLRKGTGKPPTPAELTRLYRANAKNLWQRAPWMQLSTIWFSPRLEAAFAECCHHGGLSLSQTAPVIANNLRWAWWRSVLNHDDDAGWQRSQAAARKRQAAIGPPPEGHGYVPPPTTPPTDPRIKVITRRAAAWEPASVNPLIDRATRARQRRQRLPSSQAPAKFDWRDFLDAHWSAVFGPLFTAHHLDPAEADSALGHTLAVAWHGVLGELARLDDGSVGPQQRRWHQLLRTFDHHVGRQAPAQAPAAARPPSPGRPLVGHPDNDAWLAALCTEVDARRSR